MARDYADDGVQCDAMTTATVAPMASDEARRVLDEFLAARVDPSTEADLDLDVEGANSPLRPHVLYRMSAAQFRAVDDG